MNKLFYDLLERDIDFCLEKENIKVLSQKEINLFIEDIFWRYDSNKMCFKIPSKNKENNQKIINLVVDKPYYLECLLENIEKYPQKLIDIDRNISLVEKLNINDKEVFFKILNKISCFNFFLLNYNQFIYSEEEKILIKELFATLKIYNINKKSLLKQEKENIFNKTGLISPFLRATEVNENLKDENFIFFIEHYKYNPDFEMIKFIFLYKIDYEVRMFKKEAYEIFVKNNMLYVKEYPENFKKDIAICKLYRVTEKKIIGSIEYMSKLTEQILLKYEMENF